MKTSYVWWGIVVLVILAGGIFLVLGPGDEASEHQVGAPAAPTNVEYVAGNLLLGRDSSSALGTYLIGFNGMPVYVNANDTATSSSCTGQCAANWEPYTTSDTNALKNLQAGVTGTAGTITRTDGSLQVTYNGKPLYFYKYDTTSGGPTGNGVNNVWSVVAP